MHQGESMLTVSSTSISPMLTFPRFFLPSHSIIVLFFSFCFSKIHVKSMWDINGTLLLFWSFETSKSHPTPPPPPPTLLPSQGRQSCCFWIKNWLLHRRSISTTSMLYRRCDSLSGFMREKQDGKTQLVIKFNLKCLEDFYRNIRRSIL